MTRVVLRRIKKVRKPLSDGSVRHCHYTRDTRKLFWRSDSGILVGSPEYVAAYEAACSIIAAPARNEGKFRKVLLEFYANDAWDGLSPRTQADYRTGLNDVEAVWGDAPISAIENPNMKDKVPTWIEQHWRGKEADRRLTLFKRVLSWAVSQRGKLRYNHLAGIPLYYRGSDRAEIIWLDDELNEFCTTAYCELSRAARLFSETALRPGDLVRLNRGHIRLTPKGGRAIIIRTKKSGRKRVAQSR